MTPWRRRLERLEAGQPIIFGGDRVTTVPAELAAAFRAGDRLLVVQDSGAAAAHPGGRPPARRTQRSTAAVQAFTDLARCDDAAISAFFDEFARRLADDRVSAPIRSANDADVERARAAGRSTTRLVLTPRDARRHGRRPAGVARRRRCGATSASTAVDHDRWSVEAWRAPLGVVGFVFEGRPNVFADATGVLRTGNTVVMRIGSRRPRHGRGDHGARPSSRRSTVAGLPAGAVSLVRSPARAAGWALFDDRRLDLAVARGSGAAVAELERRRPPGRHARQRSTAPAGRGSSPVRSADRRPLPGQRRRTRSTARSATR